MVLIIGYQYVPEVQRRDLVKTNVTGFVKLDNRLLSGAINPGSGIVQKKADREARGLVKLLAKVSRAVEEDPAGVDAKLREQPDVPHAEVAEFRVLLARR